MLRESFEVFHIPGNLTICHIPLADHGAAESTWAGLLLQKEETLYISCEHNTGAFKEFNLSVDLVRQL